MIIHVTLLLFICLLWVLLKYSKCSKKACKKRFIVISFFVIFLVQALRSQNVGQDTHNYFRFYSTIAKASHLGVLWEPLFEVIIRLCHYISSDPQLLIITSAGMLNTLIAVFIYQNFDESESVFWPVFFYITLLHYMNSMNLMREYLAIGIAIQSYTVLRKNNTKKGYIIAFALIGLGFLFHKSAIVYVIIPFVMSVKHVTIKHLAIVIAASIIISVLMDRIVDLVMRLFPVYNKYVDSYMLEGTSVSGYHYIIAGLKAMLVLFSLQKTCQDSYDGIGKDLIFTVISISLTLLRTSISFAIRTSYYYDMLALIFISKLPSHLQLKSNRRIIHIILFTVGIISYFYLLASQSRSRGTANYSFFWQ